MDKEFLNKMKEKLETEKKEILKKSLIEDNIDSSGDEADGAQAKLVVDVNSKLGALNKEKLYKINFALRKIHEKTYGVCEDCEEEISEKRLEINAYFMTCVLCAEEREREEKGMK